jgi:hypothetical protein
MIRAEFARTVQVMEQALIPLDIVRMKRVSSSLKLSSMTSCGIL